MDFFCNVTTDTFINDLIHFKSSSEKLFFSTILNDLLCEELMKPIASSQNAKGLDLHKCTSKDTLFPAAKQGISNPGSTLLFFRVVI